MPEPAIVAVFVSALCALFGLLGSGAFGALPSHRDRPDPLEEAATVQTAPPTAGPMPQNGARWATMGETRPAPPASAAPPHHGRATP